MGIYLYVCLFVSGKLENATLNMSKLFWPNITKVYAKNRLLHYFSIQKCLHLDLIILRERKEEYINLNKAC